MKKLLLLLLASAFLPGCLTVEPDGGAVECSACEMIWLRLDPSTGIPGTYLVAHGKKRRPCRSCARIAEAFFGGAELQPRCQRCGGGLAYRAVNILR
ncbi:MAG: hypothetical protein FGM15_08905 [Chthoniobacterales bacterium]|nr:hypothetical protein [Chthoniobacterales bacterium]